MKLESIHRKLIQLPFADEQRLLRKRFGWHQVVKESQPQQLNLVDKNNCPDPASKKYLMRIVNNNRALLSINLNCYSSWSARECYEFIHRLHSVNLQSIELTLENMESSGYFAKLMHQLAWHAPNLTRLKLNINQNYFMLLVGQGISYLDQFRKLSNLVITIDGIKEYPRMQIDLKQWRLDKQHCPTLKRLSLNFRKLKIFDNSHILALMNSGLIRQLNHLDLSYNYLKSAVIEKISDTQQFINLTSLNLSYSSIDECSLMELIKSGALKEIKALNLSKNSLSWRVLTVLNNYYLPNLVKLNLSGNNIKPLNLGYILNNFPNLTYLVLSCQIIDLAPSADEKQWWVNFALAKQKHAKIEELNLNDSDCQDEIFAGLAQAHFSQLTRLKMSYSYCSIDMFNSFVKASWFSQLEQLQLDKLQLEKSDFSVNRSSKNEYSDKFISILAKYPQQLKIEDLSVSNCGISDKGAQMIFTSPSLTNLRNLNFSDNKNISLSVLKMINVSSLTKLKEVNLNDCFVRSRYKFGYDPRVSERVNGLKPGLIIHLKRYDPIDYYDETYI